jgi:uncharacterized RDD family membrane protein YckC
MKVYVRSNGKIFGPVDFSKVALACQDGLFSQDAEISEDRIEWLSIAEAQELLKPKNAAPPPAPDGASPLMAIPVQAQNSASPSPAPSDIPPLMAIPIQPQNAGTISASPLQAQALAGNTMSQPYQLSPGQQPHLTQLTQIVKFAGFWRRFAALLVDCIVLLPIGLLLFFINFMLSGVIADILEELPPIMAIIGNLILQNILSIIAGWLYCAIMESSSMQGTVGKKALGIKVTDLSGKPISFDKASGRYFGKFISGLILGFGYLMAAFTDKKQALHDMMAGCLLVKRDSYN